MRRKCRRAEEIAAAEFPELGGGVRPRLKEEETSSETAEKRCREVGDGELDFVDSALSEIRSSTRRRVMIEAATESISPLRSAEETNSASESVSCCSSYASTQLAADRSTISNPTGHMESAQVETLTFSGGRYSPRRSEATPSSEEESGDMDSTAGAMPFTEAKSRHKPAVRVMSSGVEIEEFLSAAESDLHKRFSEKYNFDAVKGVPLKGRYEWVPVKP